MDANTAVGIGGATAGVIGGLIGTYFSVKNTSRPRERALMLRIMAIGWLWMAALLACLSLLPAPWGQLALLLPGPILLLIPRGNRLLARARAQDEAEVEVTR